MVVEMRVLSISSSISKPYLGPSVVAHNIMKGFIKIHKELEKNNVNMTFLSLNDTCNKEISDNIKIIGANLYPPVTFTGEIQAYLRKLTLKEKYDVVHSHSIYDLFPFLFTDTHTVFTLHGIYWREKEFEKGLYPKIWLKLSEIRFRLYYPKLTKFVAISPYVLEEVNAKGFDVNNAAIIGNPVSDEFFEVKKSEENIIFYPATLVPRKNQLGFLMAISIIQEELKNYKIAFTASGNPEYISMLKKFVKKNNLNVEFIGKVSYEEMPELYSKASIVALTSFQETLPMSVLEAMASGTPVLASNIGGLKYLVKDSETGFLVDPSNPKDIAEKLLIMAHDERLRARMGVKTKKEADTFRSENVAKKHLELYL